MNLIDRIMETDKPLTIIFGVSFFTLLFTGFNIDPKTFYFLAGFTLASFISCVIKEVPTSEVKQT